MSVRIEADLWQRIVKETAGEFGDKKRSPDNTSRNETFVLVRPGTELSPCKA